MVFYPMIHCESHPDAQLVEDHRAGDMICPECGFVVADRVVDVGAEWRIFESDTKDKSRVGTAQDPTTDWQELSTKIGNSRGCGSDLFKARRTESITDATKRKSTREIREMAERLSADRSIINSAQHVFHLVYKEKLNKGRSNSAIIAACMLIACRMQSAPRTFKEICAVAAPGTTVKDIGRCYKIIHKNILPKHKTQEDAANSPLLDFINRFCSKLNVAQDVKKLARSIGASAKSIPALSGRNPNSLAAGSIHLACKLVGGSDIPTSIDISDMCGTSENTQKQISAQFFARCKELNIGVNSDGRKCSE